MQIKTIARYVGATLAIGVAVVLSLAGMKPDTQRYERKRVIAAPAARVFEQLQSLPAWEAWSPWAKMDLQMKKSYTGTPGAIGSTYAWEGNREVGKGMMTLISYEAPQRILFRLEFFEPFADVQDTEFTLSETVGPDGKPQTQVTWSMFGPVKFFGKVMHVFMNMDAMIGEDFEKGLADLDRAVTGT